MNIEELEHTENFKYLIDKKIKEIRYMTKEEMEEWGWYKQRQLMSNTGSLTLKDRRLN